MLANGPSLRLLPYLPVMSGRVVDSLAVSERFLWDLRQTISDLVVENYAGHAEKLARRHGLARGCIRDRGHRRVTGTPASNVHVRNQPVTCRG